MNNKSASMTSRDAARIQSHADRSSTNQGFKARVQSAAAKGHASAPRPSTTGPTTAAGKK